MAVRDIEQHPVVRNLRVEVAALKRRNAELIAALDRTVPSTLEPLHPLPRGVFTPADGASILVHVDAGRIRHNRARNLREPVIRVHHLGGIWHAHHLRFAACELAERYDQPVSDRRQAVCVLTTDEPIEVVR